jgi:FkbM family methyltransferase
MAFYESRGVSGALTASGVWDELTLAVAAKLVDAAPSRPVVYDVGANIGTFSIPMARFISSKGGVLRAFEPQRLVFYQLCGNVFLNRLDNIYVENIALSDENCVSAVAPLDFSHATNIGAYSPESFADGQPRDSRLELCRFSRLDSFSDNSCVTLLKVDVEGMEVKVFKGAGEFLARNMFPPIIFESWRGDAMAERACRVLEEYGYRVSRYAEHDCLAQHVSSSAVI